MNIKEKLHGALECIPVMLPEGAEGRLAAYIGLLDKWNKVYNLTAIRDPQQMLHYHIVDSLAVEPLLPRVSAIADVGTGPGLPGIPLAIARPDTRVTLVESNHKKAAFLTQAKLELKLTNVEVVNERVEKFHPAEGFEVVISRAFSEMAQFVALARHLCIKGGTMAAMKGLYPHEELTRLPGDVQVEAIKPVMVPGLGAERHLVLIKVN